MEVVGNKIVTVESRLIPDFTELETKILEKTLEGMSVKNIAILTQVPQVYIRALLNKREVQQYLREVKEAVAQATQLKLQMVLTGVLEEQIDAAENLAQLTKKDPLEVMKLLAEISNQITKQQATTEETDKYAYLLQKVFK